MDKEVLFNKVAINRELCGKGVRGVWKDPVAFESDVSCQDATILNVLSAFDC